MIVNWVLDSFALWFRDALIIVTLVVVALPAVPASSSHECYFDPDLGLVCEDHSGGGGGGSSTSFWTSWQIVSECGGGGVIGGGLIDISTGLAFALCDHIVDGEVIETQTQSIDLNEAENALEGRVVRSPGKPPSR